MTALNLRRDKTRQTWAYEAAQLTCSLKIPNTYSFFLQSNKECSHVYASTRKLGTEIHWEGCDLSEEPNFYNHTCNTLEDLKELNCKYFSTETFVDEFTVSIHKHLRDFYGNMGCWVYKEGIQNLSCIPPLKS